MTLNLQPEISRLNLLPASETEGELLKCCGCNEWAQQLIAQRPFEGVADLIAKADRVWWSLEPREWLEAFHSHPKIGEQKAARTTAADAQKWSSDEQAGIKDSSPNAIVELARLNREYEAKFGYIFIVCASGKSSEEMLELLRQRMDNPPEQELRIAAAEQAKITELRLKKLLAIQS